VHPLKKTDGIDWLRPLKPAADVLHQQLGDETVLLNLRTEQYFGLDEVGSRIWQLIAKGEDVQNSITILLREYDVEESELRADVERLIRELLNASLLEQVNAASSEE
jgi:predicted RND superfamily exporter protein